jgi:hypothetical protein
METGTFFLIKYLGIVFLSASLVRASLCKNRQQELISMNLPYNFDILIILFEFMVGMILTFDLFDKKKTLITLLVFLIIGTILMIMNNYNKIINETFEVFFYNPSMESVTFHFTYLIMIIGITLNI